MNMVSAFISVLVLVLGLDGGLLGFPAFASMGIPHGIADSEDEGCLPNTSVGVESCPDGNCVVEFGGRRWWTNYHWSQEEGMWSNGQVWDPHNVHVDHDGLHLKIANREYQHERRWSSSEVVLLEDVGYGDYLVTIEGIGIDLSSLDPNLVIGAFTYQREASPGEANTYRELDLLEVARWGAADGDPPGTNAQFTVQPYDCHGDPACRNIHRFKLDAKGAPVTVAMSWAGASRPARFRLDYGAYSLDSLPESPDIEWDTTEDVAARFIPKDGCELFHLNFYKFLGADPSSSDPLEILVSNFEHKPMREIVYLPQALQSWPPLPSRPSLVPIDNADQNNGYVVQWTSADRADAYTLTEARNPNMVDATVVYEGPGTAWVVPSPGKTPATYYYRVKAKNAWGESSASEAQAIRIYPLFVGRVAQWSEAYSWKDEPPDVVLNSVSRVEELATADTVRERIRSWCERGCDFGETIEDRLHSLTTGHSKPDGRYSAMKLHHIPYDLELRNGHDISLSDLVLSVSGPHSRRLSFNQTVRSWRLTNRHKFYNGYASEQMEWYVHPGDAELWFDAGDTQLLLYQDVTSTLYHNGKRRSETVRMTVNLISSNAYPEMPIAVSEGPGNYAVDPGVEASELPVSRRWGVVRHGLSAVRAPRRPSSRHQQPGPADRPMPEARGP